MSYVAVAIILLLILGGFVTFLTLNATRRSSNPGGAPGIGGDDATALGDTPEHTDDPQPPVRYDEGPTPIDPTAAPDGRYKRDVIGGEAEGDAAISADDARPS